MTMGDNEPEHESAEYAARRASGVVYYAEAVDRHLALAAAAGTDSGVTRYHLDAAAVNATMAQAAATLLRSGMGIVRPLDTP